MEGVEKNENSELEDKTDILKEKRELIDSTREELKSLGIDDCPALGLGWKEDNSHCKDCKDVFPKYYEGCKKLYDEIGEYKTTLIGGDQEMATKKKTASKKTASKKTASKKTASNKTASKKTADVAVDSNKLVGKKCKHLKKGLTIEVLSVMKNSETGVNVKYSDGTKGTASVKVLEVIK